MRPPLPRRGFPALTPDLLDPRPGSLAASSPDLRFSAHALARCAERGVSPDDLAVVAARPTFLTRQPDGTVRVTGVVIGSHARWFVEAIVWVTSVSCWFVLTAWRSGIGARPSSSKRIGKAGRGAK
jgi:hypothetical protein